MRNWIRNHPNVGGLLGLLVVVLFILLCVVTNGIAFCVVIGAIVVTGLFFMIRQAIKDFL